MRSWIMGAHLRHGIIVPKVGSAFTPQVNSNLAYPYFNELISITNRYFTSWRNMRSKASLIC